LRHIGENEFLYGNLIESSVSEIIYGAARSLKMAAVAKDMDIENCHLNCRMEPINYYLWELDAPSAHANFI
jgi:hypothetical protein